MIVSNEPAYYEAGGFGVRVESHLVTVPSKQEGFLEFEQLLRLPIDPLLMDPSLLTSAEKQWLANYHARIVGDYEGCFDEETTGWLQRISDSFAAMINT